MSSLFDHCVDAGAVGQVECHRPGLSAAGSYFGGGLLHGVGIAIQQCDPGAFPREDSGHGAAHSAPRASDQGGAPVKHCSQIQLLIVRSPVGRSSGKDARLPKEAIAAVPLPKPVSFIAYGGNAAGGRPHHSVHIDLAAPSTSKRRAISGLPCPCRPKRVLARHASISCRWRCGAAARCGTRCGRGS